MENVGIYTTYLQRICLLNSKELSIETINEAHSIYLELKNNMEKLDVSQNAEINGYEFLINEIRYILFDLIKKTGAPISNRIRKGLARELEKNEDIIDNIITVNNHAFIVTHDEKDTKAHLVEDYLMDITNYKFMVSQEGQKTLNSKEFFILKNIIYELNECLKTLDLNGNCPNFILNNNRVVNQDINDNVHIYISDSIYDIIYILSHKKEEPIEIIVEDNANDYYYFVLSMVNGKINIIGKDYDKWELISSEKHNIKIKR